MSVSDVILKTLQLVKHQHGMPKEQAFCDHEFEAYMAHPVTFELLERRCKKCYLVQKAKTVWEDVVDLQAHFNCKSPR